MGFEAGRRLTTDQILAGLNDGTIRSPREITDIEIVIQSGPIIKARINKTENTISYTHNGISVEATFDDSGIGRLVLTDPLSDLSITDELQLKLHKSYLDTWFKQIQ